jgi:hypothetical protein
MTSSFNRLDLQRGKIRMTTHKYVQLICLVSLFTFTFTLRAFGHGDGASSTGDLTKVIFIPNPSVPEFADVKGTLLIDLAEGAIQLADFQGFPFDSTRNRFLPRNVTSTTDPRFINSDGTPAPTSCHPASTSETQGPIGPWTCHVHSYVVWLVGLENGSLEHPLSVGTIYPRTDGTAAERNFSFREGDLTGFGHNAIIITAEGTFGAAPSVSQASDGSFVTEIVPRGPIVLQANLP